MESKNNSFISKLLSQILIIAVSITILFPLYFMFVNSFKEHNQYVNDNLGFPSPFVFDNYVEAFKGKPFGQWFLNSTLLTLFTAVACGMFALMAGYAFAKMKFKGKKTLFNIVIPLMSVPPVAMLIPQFQLVSKLGMVNTRFSVVLIYIGILLPMTLYMIRNFLVSVPNSLLEAAIIDGCGSFRTLLYVIVPLSIPALITSTMVNIVWTWNELLISLVFLQKENLRTLIVGITLFKGRFTLNIPVIMAGMAIATVPMILIYAFAQKYLVEGLLAGSIKE